MTDADYADSLALHTNTPAQAEFFQQSFEQAARGIDLYVNSDKNESMCFKQDGTISTLNGKHLKLGDQFKYLGSYISSTERDINIHIGKMWITVHRLLMIWKSDHSE